MDIKIAPSILSADFAYMGDAVKNIEKWGADYVHCDIMDGVYVNNITFGIEMIRAIKKYTSLPLDVHLMIVKPEKYVKEFIKAGANIITFHADATDDVDSTIALIKDMGAQAGLVINPDKDIEHTFAYLKDISVVMFMGVFPGFGGQCFIECVYDKISALKKHIQDNNYNVMLEVDGGVNLNNAPFLKECGIEILVAGNTVFTSSDPKDTIEKLRNIK